MESNENTKYVNFALYYSTFLSFLVYHQTRSLSPLICIPDERNQQRFLAPRNCGVHHRGDRGGDRERLLVVQHIPSLKHFRILGNARWDGRGTSEGRGC